MDFSSDRLDRLRFESIERRRQLCSDVVKGRKRKLSELYFLSRSPSLPITDEVIASEDDFLMAFLEKNDLESGHLFEESSLPQILSTNKVKKIDAVESIHQAATHQNRIHTHVASQAGTAQQVSTTSDARLGVRAPPYTPQQQAVSVNAAQSHPTPTASPHARMTTRVSSGALKHKSVTELLGTTPKSGPRRITSVSTIEPVLVAKPKPSLRVIATEEPPVKPGIPLVKIYYSIQASALANFIPSAHKSLTTDNFLTIYTESILQRTFGRIDELKREGKWSLRQPQRFRAPKRPKSHWDYVLGEMQVTALDFANGHKRNVTESTDIASWIKDYWTYGKAVCIKTRPPRLLTDEEVEAGSKGGITNDEEMEEANEGGIMNGVKDNTSSDSHGSLFSMNGMNKVTGIFSEKHYASIDPAKDEPFRDSIEELPIVPINKFAMLINNISPEQLSSWKQRHQDGASSTDSKVDELQAPPAPPAHPLEQQPQRKEGDQNDTQRPLFLSESARRGVYIKAPPPPSLRYVEFGVPTIWLPQDDANLLKLASEFMYNWDVVSANMSPRQSWGLHSNIERRTPWECFERWMQLEPNFQLSDLRGPYARSAQIWIEATSRAQLVTKRRMVPMGITPDNTQRGQRRLRWSGMFEAIRKSIRKRENARRFGSR
ncbi:hypothetical protein POJ06DRAFT_263584 [Lipomyces tetrasporus]|uniref:Chromatin modification-related protein EAF1 n=1 Tax=Lipomyces tetrasporus TaxID=54092 RepID=A0AAD7QKP3_9ASCO|nr:uncharacterized protein POJ06DRAFT_263584 [Lipomyces tetrasporus]KAJ8096858.1 hypothetical protein POJ06DRAFT_263584 [Lipomyces tetrasporus]